MSDEKTLRAFLRAGDQAAFAVLYREHVDRVFGLAYRWTGDRAGAEDVVAETFLVAWRRRAELTDDDRPLHGWLLAIATNQALNLVRARRRRAAFLRRQDPRLDVVPDIADGVVARVDDGARLERTRAALSQLSRGEQQVIGLCVWGGLGRRDAALALGVPEGTVASRLARARERLRTLVDESDARTHDQETRR